ncbi:MAG: hypothetical protein ABWX84_06360 [Nocardioides sp.]
MVTEQSSRGKHGGSRRGPKQRKPPKRGALLLALATTLLVVAWGYLVKTAVDFGSAARGGESAAWGFLAISCLGAAACLFIGLILIARLLRALGITTGDTTADPSDAPSVPPRQPGGRRASR